MIPKVIHYCWFGNAELPELAKKCINSWKIFFPDYEIKEWNENNYDVNKNLYIQQAYEKKKFAFVSDYARLDILYNYGGIYFDTDVEVIRDFSEIIKNGPFLGLETSNTINVGLGMAAEKKMDILKEILESYENDKFIMENDSLNVLTIVDRVTSIMKKEIVLSNFDFAKIKGFTIYPVEYFCPKDIKTGVLKITENTYSIHYFDGSWLSESLKVLFAEKYWINQHVKSKLIIFILEKFCVIKRLIKDYILKK